MIILLKIWFKLMYWVFIGWWLKPIQYFKRRKIQKMQDEITMQTYANMKKED